MNRQTLRAKFLAEREEGLGRMTVAIEDVRRSEFEIACRYFLAAVRLELEGKATRPEHHELFEVSRKAVAFLFLKTLLEAQRNGDGREFRNLAKMMDKERLPRQGPQDPIRQRLLLLAYYQRQGCQPPMTPEEVKKEVGYQGGDLSYLRKLATESKVVLRRSEKRGGRPSKNQTTRKAGIGASKS